MLGYGKILDIYIKNLYLVNKLTMQEIATKLNCNRKTISKILNRLNITRIKTSKYSVNENYFDILIFDNDKLYNYRKRQKFLNFLKGK